MELQGPQTYEARGQIILDAIDNTLKDLILRGFTFEEIALQLDDATFWMWDRHFKQSDPLYEYGNVNRPNNNPDRGPQMFGPEESPSKQ